MNGNNISVERETGEYDRNSLLLLTKLVVWNSMCESLQYRYLTFCQSVLMKPWFVWSRFFKYCICISILIEVLSWDVLKANCEQTNWLHYRLISWSIKRQKVMKIQLEFPELEDDIFKCLVQRPKIFSYHHVW